MKLAELKNRLKSKYTVRIIAGVLTIALLGTSVGVYSVSAAKTEKQDKTNVVESILEDNVDIDVEGILGEISKAKDSVDKEETVYVITDATGNATETIVVDHLLNNKKEDSLTDITTLKDIENVKGKETFTQDGNKLTWDAKGGEIYYQGSSDVKTPVTQKVTYTLDGKEITPEELRGKSGKVTIRFDYVNETAATDMVPFAAISALTLDEKFKNVEVTNATVKENGDSSIIIGYALPGMGTNLDLDLPEYFEITADVEEFDLSTCMTMVVNVAQYIADKDSEKLSLDDKVNELSDGTSQLSDGAGALSDGLLTLKESLPAYNNGMSTFKTGLDAYLNGTQQLDDGITTLKNNTGALVNGASELNKGAGELKNGAQSLSNGASELYAGATSLSDGADAVSEGINAMLEALPAQMKAGINAMLDQLNTTGFATAVYASGYTSDSAGKITVDNVNQITAYVAENEVQIETTLVVSSLMAKGYTKEQAMQYITTAGIPAEAQAQAQAAYKQALAGLYQGQGAVALYSQTSRSIATNDDIKALVTGAGALAQGAENLETGAGALATGAGALATGANQLSTGTQSLVDKIPSLTSGIDMLKTGSGKLVQNNLALNTGITQLSDGTTDIVDGVDKLFDGSIQLSDGADELMNAIAKVVDAYDGDLKPLEDKLEAMADAGAGYQTYTALPENAKGSVKFIYKLNY